MIHSKLIFFFLTHCGFDKVATHSLILLTTSVTTAVTQPESWRTITRLISCSFKLRIIEIKFKNAVLIMRGSLGANGFSSLPGLKWLGTYRMHLWSKAVHFKCILKFSFVPLKDIVGWKSCGPDCQTHDEWIHHFTSRAKAALNSFEPWVHVRLY